MIQVEQLSVTECNSIADCHHETKARIFLLVDLQTLLL